MRVDNILGASTNPATGQKADKAPQALWNAKRAVETYYEQQAAAARTAAATLTGTAQTQKLEEADHLASLAIADTMRISGPDGLKLLVKSEAKADDASHASLAATNATLWRIGYGYETGKPQEAWVTNVPANHKVTFNVVTTPSAHNGAAAFENYARTNQYVVEVSCQSTPTSPLQRVGTFTFGVTNPPEYSTVSPSIDLDLSQLKGDIIFDGWPVGSSGIGGYIEARRTILHNP